MAVPGIPFGPQFGTMGGAGLQSPPMGLGGLSGMAYTPGGAPAATPGRSPGFSIQGGYAQQQELEAWARADQDWWTDRNERFQRDQDLYQLAKPMDMPRNAANAVVLNDPRVLVDKVVRILARHPNVIEVPPAPGVDPTIAQKLENFLYNVDRAINSRWADGLNSPYRYDQAFFPVLRGWATERTVLFPEGSEELKGDPSAMWDHQVIDPACVFPFKAGGKIRRVTHAYRTTIGEMLRDPLLRPFVQQEWFDQDERSRINVTALYWQDFDGGWWHAIIGGLGAGTGSTGGGNLWIKPPTEIGYNPWTIVLFGGASYRETPWDDTEYAAQMGTGILDASAENQKHLNRMVTRLMELLAQESNPPVSLFSGTGSPKRIDVSAGARNFFAEKDKIELHRVGPQMGDFQLLYDILMQRGRRAGLPDAFFSEYGGSAGMGTGFGQSILLAAGKDILSVYADGLNIVDQKKYQKMLEIYRDFGPNRPLPTQLPMGNGMMAGLQSMVGPMAQQMGAPNPMQQMGPMGMGNPMQQSAQMNPLGGVQYATIDVYEILQQGTYIEIERDDMTPQETAARINLAMAMADKKVISLETARKDWVKLRNPALENLKVLNEAVYMDPSVIQLLIPLTLSATGQQFLANLWYAIQNPMPPQGQLGAPGEGPNEGGPNPAPGQPQQGPPRPPQPHQMPGQIMPPVAQTGNMLTNQVDPQVVAQNQLLQILTGGAVGGAGGGGTPPINGLTGRGRMLPGPMARGF